MCRPLRRVQPRGTRRCSTHAGPAELCRGHDGTPASKASCGVRQLDPQVAGIVGVALELAADEVVVLSIAHEACVAVGGSVELFLLASAGGRWPHAGGVAALAADRGRKVRLSGFVGENGERMSMGPGIDS
jgi:hypothetical protein